LRNAAASAEVKRKSAARSSVNWLRAQPGQGQRWVLAGSDDEVQLGRQVFNQKRERLVNHLAINHMVIVKDEDEVVGNRGDVVEQGGENRFDWRWLRSLERT
jgi:hypothetical protein